MSKFDSLLTIYHSNGSIRWKDMQRGIQTNFLHWHESKQLDFDNSAIIQVLNQIEAEVDEQINQDN